VATISIRELNSNISKALARVEAGETLEVTRNGKPIADIRPKRPLRDEKFWQAHEESKVLLLKGFPGKVGRITEEDKYGDAAL
jgi:prevent-host-death family protein